MPTYRVVLREVTFKGVTVDADNPEDAEEKALEHGGDFEYLDGGDTQVVSIGEEA
jgi:hypothetical protein